MTKKETFKKLVARVNEIFANRNHCVKIWYEDSCLVVEGINVPMLADCRMIAKEFKADCYVDNGLDCVGIEL